MLRYRSSMNFPSTWNAGVTAISRRTSPREGASPTFSPSAGCFSPPCGSPPELRQGDLFPADGGGHVAPALGVRTHAPPDERERDEGKDELDGPGTGVPAKHVEHGADFSRGNEDVR